MGETRTIRVGRQSRVREPAQPMPAISQTANSTPGRFRPVPIWPPLLPVTCTNGRWAASAVTRRPRPFRLVPRGPASGGGKVEGNPGRRPTRVPNLCRGNVEFESVGPTGPRRLPDGVHHTDGAVVVPCPRRSSVTGPRIRLLPDHRLSHCPNTSVRCQACSAVSCARTDELTERIYAACGCWVMSSRPGYSCM
jgi:hypothetical protein